MTSFRIRPATGVRPAPPAGRAIRLSAVAFIAYSIAIPLVAAIGLGGSPITWIEAAGILLGLTLYSGTRIAYELGRDAPRWFVLIFHSFTYVFLGVTPLAQIGARILLWVVAPSSNVLVEAAVVCLVGVVTFDLGLWVSGSFVSRPARQPPVRSGLLKPTADRALAFLVALSLLSLVLLWTRGALGFVLSSQSEMAAVLCPVMPTGDLAECGVTTALVRVPPVLLMIVALGLHDRAGRVVGRTAIIVGLLCLVLTANPVSAPRIWLGAAAIGVLGALASRSVRSQRLLLLAIPAVLILVFPVLDFARYGGWTANVSPSSDAIVQKQDFDAFQQVANGITFVDAYGTRGGSQISSALLFFIPRSLWSDKAPATGPLVTASLGVTANTNVSAPLWEEAYVDFGLAGVVAALGLLGCLTAYLELAVQSSSARGGGVGMVVVPYFAAYGVFILRGSLLPAIGPLAFAILLLLLVRRLTLERVSVPGVSRLEPPAFRGSRTASRRGGLAPRQGRWLEANAVAPAAVSEEVRGAMR